MPEPIFMKLGMYIMAPEPISTAYFRNPSTSLLKEAVTRLQQLTAPNL
jgi:hypothetical protein